MNENCVTLEIPDRLKEQKSLVQEIIQNINVAVIPSTEEGVLRLVHLCVT